MSDLDDLDFDDVTLGDTSEVGTGIADPINPEPTTPQETAEPENKKQRGRPKKDATTTGTEDDNTSKKEPTGSAKNDFVEEITTDDEEEEDDTDEDKDSGESNFIKSIADKLGIELGEDEEFEDSEDGLIQFTQRAAEEFADAKLNGWLEALPPVASNFFDYLQMLGEDATEDKVKSFFTTVNPEIDYKSVDLTNEDIQKSVMRTFYRKMDYSDDEIKEAIDDLEIAGTLSKQAKTASTKLAAIQEKEMAGLLEEERQANIVKKQNTQRFFGNVKQVIDNGKVNNFSIPVSEKKAIFDYDVQGAFMKDLNEILKDPSKRVELAIAVKNKFNLNKYISAAAQTQKANGLRDKLKSGTSKLKGGNATNGVANDSIDWDNMEN
jgi:hypothetical protein